ncbi:MAG: hypothetical protein AAF628_06225 [Planctomycetota bacterium]
MILGLAAALALVWHWTWQDPAALGLVGLVLVWLGWRRQRAAGGCAGCRLQKNARPTGGL